MRTKLLVLVLTLCSTGCATGFRVGGNHYGAGVGGYIGPVPEVGQNSTYYPPPVILPPEPQR